VVVGWLIRMLGLLGWLRHSRDVRGLNGGATTR